MNPEDIQGWMLPHELDWLREEASKCNHLIIEIGTWKGRSTSAICSSTKARVITIDTYTGSPIDPVNYKELEQGVDVKAIAMANLKEYLDSGQLTMTSTIPLIPRPEADMLFIDGDHDYPQVLSDILRYIPFVKDEGLISGHDIHLSPVHTAVTNVMGYWEKGPGTIWYRRIN